jgi:hypothetical protein
VDELDVLHLGTSPEGLDLLLVIGVDRCQIPGEMMPLVQELLGSLGEAVDIFVFGEHHDPADG